TPPFVDVHVAVYCGALSALPLACAAVRFGKVTRSTPRASRAVVGRATCAGAPTVIGSDAADGTLVPPAFVAVTLHVYARSSDAPPTTIVPAVAASRTALRATPPLDDVHAAVYFVIAAPALAGVVNATAIGPVTAVVGIGRATTPAGARGAPTTSA